MVGEAHPIVGGVAALHKIPVDGDPIFRTLEAHADPGGVSSDDRAIGRRERHDRRVTRQARAGETSATRTATARSVARMCPR